MWGGRHHGRKLAPCLFHRMFTFCSWYDFLPQRMHFFFYLFQFYFWRKKGANNKRQWNRTFVVKFFNITGSYVVIYRGGLFVKSNFFYHTENNLWTARIHDEPYMTVVDYFLCRYYVQFSLDTFIIVCWLLLS